MELRLAAIFGDNMVLQREVPAPLWGAAPAGAEVTAELDGQSVRTCAGKTGTGHWLSRSDYQLSYGRLCTVAFGFGS